MGLEEFFINLSDLVPLLPAEVWAKIMDLILVLKALSVIAIIYVLYIIVMGILTYRKMRNLDYIKDKTDDISKKVNSMDKKLNKLIKEKKR